MIPGCNTYQQFASTLFAQWFSGNCFAPVRIGGISTLRSLPGAPWLVLPSIGGVLLLKHTSTNVTCPQLPRVASKRFLSGKNSNHSLANFEDHALAEGASEKSKAGLKAVPIIIEDKDLKESFVKGSGKGGQKINKTSNCVILKHLPTGIVVRNQQTRSREINRRIARKILKDKVDLRVNGALSKEAQRIERLQQKKARRRQRSGGLPKVTTTQVGKEEQQAGLTDSEHA